MNNKNIGINRNIGRKSSNPYNKSLIIIYQLAKIMNIDICVRCIHITYIEKVLKVFLIPSSSNDYTFPGSNDYTLPVVIGTAPAADNSSAHILNPLLNTKRHFCGQINRIPVWKSEKNNPYLSFDFYILIKPELLLDSFKGGKWFSLQEALKLNFEISAVIAHTLKRLREELNYQPIEYHLLPATFTIPELQCLYELILDKKINRANFYRKIFSMDILKSEGVKRMDTTYRAPSLYAFNKNYFKKTEEGLFKEF